MKGSGLTLNLTLYGLGFEGKGLEVRAQGSEFRG